MRLNSRMSLGLGGRRRAASDPSAALLAAFPYWFDSADATALSTTLPNRGTAGGTVIEGATPPVWGDGSIDFVGGFDTLRLPAGARPTATATSGDSTVVVAFTSTGSGGQSIWDTRSTATNGFGIYLSTDTMVVIVGGADGTKNRLDIDARYRNGDVHVVALSLSSGILTLWSDLEGRSAGVSTATGVGTITQFATPSIGAYAYGNALDFVGGLKGVAVTNTYVSDTDLATIAARYLP